MWQPLIDLLIPILVSFLIGLIIKSPVYQKGKRLVGSFAKALEDDKVSGEEWEELKSIWNGKHK